MAGLWINGESVGARSGRTFNVTNPATGTVVGEAAAGGPQDAADAVTAAAQAFPEWAATPARERGLVLRRAAELLQEWSAEIAELITLEQGKPLASSRHEVGEAAEFFVWFAEEARRGYGRTIPASIESRRLLTIRQPLGVVAAITPWNVPVLMLARKIAPALAAGCTVVAKPAEQTPLSAQRVADALHAAGLPAGGFNIVTGEPEPIGTALLDDPRVRKVSFTGSTEVGRWLTAASAKHLPRLSLELGGNAPAIVFPDAEPSAAARAIADLKFRNAGQACMTVNRVFVHDDIHDEVVDALSRQARELRVGNGMDPATQVGPLIDEQAIDKVTRHVDDAVRSGAVLVAGGERLLEKEYAQGAFFPPTVVTGVQPSMRLSCEETFGPVAGVARFTEEDGVIEAANDTLYGLSAYVFTSDLARAIRVAERLDVGMVGINETRLSAVEAPFGGVKASGAGREGGAEGLDEFLETKLLAIGVTR